ncbi:MAG: hypothetical protein DI551_03845 [Micavibrio aeruginosavorus]|uniref:AsmA-like C-terminal domain-containing protein n=1 Tax=Micavibrio aeruginosavorus TaxID=349221 RepID=A0A2W5Q745_9BACT|nr:MAG: hypothetical protein DI551_03845 [Micavibrio aeruginosavorus]
MLREAGFKDAAVEHLSITPGGLHATNIRLDRYGFDEIKKLDASFNWLSFLSGGNVSQIHVDGLSLSRNADDTAASAQKLFQNLLHLPPYRLAITNIQLDLSTDFGDLRFTGEATTEPSQGQHKIRANINANQYQLGLTSTWEGTLQSGGILDLAGTVVDGRMNAGPLRISRFNGWAGVAVNKDGYSLQSQLDAGSASFMSVPLQTISIVSDISAKQDSIIARAGISGMPDVLFTADMTGVGDDRNFTARLSGKNLGGLLDHIDEVTKSGKNIHKSLLDLRDFALSARFEPEKRFVGGPMPFGISLEANGESELEGNVLFYPDTLDMRGSLETEPEIARALQDYFHIPSANIKQNFIRLDGDVKHLFDFTEPPGTAAVPATP